VLTRPRAAVAALTLASVPYWLPAGVVALRMRVFKLVNGDEGIAVPGPDVDASRFAELRQEVGLNG